VGVCVVAIMIVVIMIVIIIKSGKNKHTNSNVQSNDYINDPTDVRFVYCMRFYGCYNCMYVLRCCCGYKVLQIKLAYIQPSNSMYM